MKKANIHEAKTHLSKLIECVVQGEEIIICKNRKPIAKLVAYKAPEGKRPIGVWKNKVVIKPDFDELPESFMSHFE